MKTDGPVPNRANAVFVYVNKPEVRGNVRREFEGLTSTNVVGNAFEALQEFQAEETEKTNEKNYSQRDQTRDKFERFGLHDER
jgi:hypothetical protein